MHLLDHLQMDFFSSFLNCIKVLRCNVVGTSLSNFSFVVQETKEKKFTLLTDKGLTVSTQVLVPFDKSDGI